MNLKLIFNVTLATQMVLQSPFTKLAIALIPLCSLTGLTPPALAQSNQQPDNLIPLPELPEPALPAQDLLPPELDLDPSLEPEITIREGENRTIEEYRINGELYMIKIIPRIGKPYYLVNRHGVTGIPHRGDMESGVTVPMWRIYRF